LADIADRAEECGFKPPAVTIVGEVVALREKLKWFDRRPLCGKKIVVTRAAEQAGEFSAKLAARGAMTLECPTIRLVGPESWQLLDLAIRELSGYDWVVLTSGNAVRYFFQRMDTLGLDVRALAGCRICAVGPKTADEIRSFGIKPDLVPTDYKAEGVVEEFSRLDMKDSRVLFPRADKARDVIQRELKRMGAHVDSPVAYRNVFPERLPPETLFALEKRSVDCVTFTSSSTVQNLAAMLGEELMLDMLKGVAVASIGPITSKSCRDLGLKVDIEPESYTLDALADALEAHFG
jgi:uroporphyrinogen III methyltransferase/synthase